LARQAQETRLIIQPTSLAALTWAGAASGSLAESWRIGTVLSARPLGVGNLGRLVIQIGALTVEAESLGTPLPSQFQVRVLSLGSQPLLEILGTTQGDPMIQRAMRERLPQQNGYAPLLATLGALAQRPILRQLPPHLRAALAMLEHGVRTPGEVTRGEGLREAIRRSGLFFESDLAQPHADPAVLGTEDWKGVLLRLATLLASSAPSHPPTASADTPPPLQQRGLRAQPRASPPLPPTAAGAAADAEAAVSLPAGAAAAASDVEALLGRLHGDVRAALARIEIAQLDAAVAQAWMIEIPLQGEEGRDVLQIHLEHGQDAETSASTWTLGFAIDLPALGPLQGELQLCGLRLGVRLWAERSYSTVRLENQFGALRQRLAASGLVLDQLSCQTGLPQGAGRQGALLLKATA
jgi:hypothetical protein